MYSIGSQQKDTDDCQGAKPPISSKPDQRVVKSFGEIGTLHIVPTVPGATAMSSQYEATPQRVNSIDEQIAEAEARIKTAEMRREEILQQKRDELAKKQRLDDLRRHAEAIEAEVNTLVSRASNLRICMRDNCETMFLPKKAGDSLCDTCESKRKKEAMQATPLAPTRVSKTQAGPSTPKESCANTSCKKLHNRSSAYKGKDSYCPTCRDNYKAEQQLAKSITSSQPEESKSPKKKLKLELELMVRRSQPLPDWVEHSIEGGIHHLDIKHPELGTFHHYFDMPLTKR